LAPLQLGHSVYCRLTSVITLGGAYNGGGALSSHAILLHWAVGLHQRRRRLFVLKAEVAA